MQLREISPVSASLKCDSCFLVGEVSRTDNANVSRMDCETRAEALVTFVVCTHWLLCSHIQGN